MGYRVVYQPIKKLRGREKRHSRIAALTGMFFLLFLLVVGSLWPKGQTVLQKMLFSGDAAVTVAALEEMASDLHAGMPFSSALEEFCHYVVSRASGSED